MEDLSKYVFDPEHPRDFLAYNLLLKILRDGNNMFFADPVYYTAIFENEIFDKKTVADLWDKPANFEELEVEEKVEIFIRNYSKVEFDEKFINALGNLNWNSLINIFNQLVSSIVEFNDTTNFLGVDENDQYVYGSFLDFSKESIISNIYWGLLNSSIDTYYIDAISNLLKSSNLNPIIVSSSAQLTILNLFNYERTTLLITKIHDYEKFPPEIIKNPNIKPILLKSSRDIVKLLDFLYRDLKQIKAIESNSSEKEISYIDSIKIQNYFSIKDFKKDNLKDKKEIYFLGENGDGKTILLQAIVLALKGNQNEGTVIDLIKKNYENSLHLEVNDSSDTTYTFKENPDEQETSYKNLFGYGIARNRTDSEKKDHTGYLTLFSNEQYLESPVKWLQHIDYKSVKGETVAITLDKAKELLVELLDRNIEISVSPDKVVFTERGTELSFAQLSDGYRSLISMLCDLLARLAENQPEVERIENFRGIVLIDELDMFLHPKWENSIMAKLRSKFPNIQFIITTHSPVLIMGASADAVFYKLYKEGGETKVSEAYSKDISKHLVNGIISSPLFNLEDVSEIENDDYLYAQIHKQVSAEVKKMRQEGKIHISQEEINKMIQEAMSQFQPA